MRQKLRRWDWGNLGTQFSCQKRGENYQKNMITRYTVYSEQTAILSILLSGAELTESYSVQFQESE